MAEKPTNFEFTAVHANDIADERQRSWHRFTRFIVWGVVVTVAVLVGLVLFVA